MGYTGLNECISRMYGDHLRRRVREESFLSVIESSESAFGARNLGSNVSIPVLFPALSGGL